MQQLSTKIKSWLYLQIGLSVFLLLCAVCHRWQLTDNQASYTHGFLMSAVFLSYLALLLCQIVNAVLIIVNVVNKTWQQLRILVGFFLLFFILLMIAGSIDYPTLFYGT